MNYAFSCFAPDWAIGAVMKILAVLLKYRDSPVSAVFWSPANCTIGKTALIEH